MRTASSPYSLTVEIPLELVLSGRELTEPKLSPDGERIAFVERWRSASAILVVDIEACEPARALSFGPDPAPGRGMGGGCYSWLTDSTGVVYAAVDGELWCVARTRSPPRDRSRTQRSGSMGVWAVRRVRSRRSRGVAHRSRNGSGPPPRRRPPRVLFRSLRVTRCHGRVMAGMVATGDAVGWRRTRRLPCSLGDRGSLDVATGGRSRPAAALRSGWHADLCARRHRLAERTRRRSGRGRRG